MIIFIVHDLSVLTFESKGDAPISTDINSPGTGSISFQLVKSKAGKIHILRLSRSVESAKYQTELFGMKGLNSGDTSGFEEAPQALMLEAPNH